MAKATRPSTIAIRDGIAVRLQELGFEKRSIRLYLKESGCLSEWAHFRVDREQNFVDTYGVFDNAMAAFFNKYLPANEPTSAPAAPRPAHLMAEALPEAAHRVYFSREAWKQNRSLRRPWEYFRDPPAESLHWMHAYITENDQWRPSDDPAGCAAASQEAWVARIEPFRAELLADPFMVAREIDANGFSHVRVVRRVYRGDIEGARALADDLIAREGMPPHRDHIESVRRQGRNVDEYIRNNIRSTRETAIRIRRLRDKLGI